MKAKEKNITLILVLFLLLVSLFSSFSLTSVYALDNKNNYSNVLDDLKADENFNADKYVENPDNNNLQIIQIAESEAKELFIYIYQPNITGNYDLTPTTISISTAINDNAKWQLYNLTLLNTNKTLFKYKVENLVVKEDALRYYDITEMHRKFIKELDGENGNDNIVNEVPIKVAQRWTACTVDNKVTYVQTKNDVVEITDKYVDFLRYPQATWFGGLDVDSHYVAFSTDHNIENLYEVDINFVTRTFKKTYTWSLDGEQVASENNQNHTAMITTSQKLTSGTTYEHGDYINHDKTFTYEDKVDYEIGNGWGFTTKYNWKRVQSVESFITEVESNKDLKVSFTETAKNNVKNKQWVLRFYESEYKDNATYVGPLLTKRIETGTDVEQVTILRLKFEASGTVYNLGVVDNKQTGDDEPGNNVQTNYQYVWKQIIETFNNVLNFLKNNWQYFVYAILAIIALIVIAPFMPMIVTGIGKLIVTIFKGIWWAITLPFNILKTKTTEDSDEQK